ncbi:MAG: hypothetical protein HZB39_06235 [Planctomycetes bacterium]|nr:hypothetical protein [Planctomycetota bacterium]
MGAAALVTALSTGPWQGAPVTPPAAEEAEAESQQAPQNLVAEVATIPRTKEPAAAAIERTEVPVDPSARSAPLGDEARVRLRATALAQRLGLSAAGEETLTAVLLEEQSRRASALTELRRKPDDAEARTRVRSELDAILAWKTKALSDRFGAEHAAEILKRR